LLVECAAHIIADSASSKKDLVELFGVPEDRVTVVHLGCSLPPAAGNRGPRLPGKYLLHVGERGRYKNFGFAVRSLAPLFRDNPDLWLVCSGGGPFTGEERSLLAGLGLEGRCLQAGFTDRELAATYGGAVALVFPSLCEGFGIPVLEAFACGCPTLLARRSSLPEVGGTAALYFDPEEGEELLSQARRLMIDSTLRGSLVGAGRERVNKFTWEQTAAHTKGVYARGMGGAGS
jgi:glycosyltransferase involved in cell wall biosynthesis